MPMSIPYRRLSQERKLWQSHSMLGSLGVLGMLSLHAARILVPPPARLPWLYDRLFITTAFLYFASVAIYLQVRCRWNP